MQIQEVCASVCVQEGSTLLDLFAHLPVLSIQRAMEEVSFKLIPFIISRTPGHPVPPPRGHSWQLSNAPFQQGISVYRRAFQMMTVNSFSTTSPSRRCGCLSRMHKPTGRDCKTQVLNPY